jgi:DNA-binding CsgD family transcriptional regulator
VVQDDLALARAWLMLAQGDARAAADAALELDRADSWGCGSPTLLPWRSVASVALAQLGEEERALALAQEELQLAQQLGTPRAVGIAQRAVALAGPPEERQAGLEAAVAVLESGGARLELARVTCELGAELRRSGERSAARDVLRRAHTLATECGATRLANRARDELGRSGARLMREPARGVEGLTPSEVRVAELAAEGLTNREVAQALFVSEKTVETHLGRVYRKLDIKSRHALPGALGERHSADTAEVAS